MGVGKESAVTRKVTKWFEHFRRHVLILAGRHHKLKDKLTKPKLAKIDIQIGLGVLLWGMGSIAGADGKFLPGEDKKIKDIILSYTNVSKPDLPVVLTAVKQAAVGKINFYRIAREINKTLSDAAKASLIENLFRVAYADKNLYDKEYKIIEEISSYFQLTKADLLKINDKIKGQSG